MISICHAIKVFASIFSHKDDEFPVISFSANARAIIDFSESQEILT